RDDSKRAIGGDFPRKSVFESPPDTAKSRKEIQPWPINAGAAIRRCGKGCNDTRRIGTSRAAAPPASR
ncbi:MAG TPA: hypothetical protein VH105_01235, partial [Burkholderiales bacterium]|nr:hypothetical protein [Burkholderiales bacterium]